MDLRCPRAGKSAIATTLYNKFSNIRRCAKFSAKRDIADRRDPKCVWRTLAYSLADLHIGLKGSIMEALLNDSHYSPTASVHAQFRDLIAGALQDQQFLSVVVVLDALDECFTEDNKDWKELLQSVAVGPTCHGRLGWWSPVATIPDIRSSLAEVSHPVSLMTGKEALEAKSDTEMFFRAKFMEMPKGFEGIPPGWPSEELIRQLNGLRCW